MKAIKRTSFKKEFYSLYFGIIIMIVFLLWSILPGIFSPYNPKEMFSPWLAMSLSHLLGTNDMGYDIFSELIYAASRTLFTGFCAAFVSLIIGTTLGTLSGYLEGWAGEGLDFIINIFLLIPTLPMMVVVAAFVGPGTFNIILIISLLGWCSTARAVRARTKQIKHSPFVEALTISGISEKQIVLKHIIPNLSDVIFAKYIMSVASCMLMEATVSFMGLGDPTHVTWGSMINFAFSRGGFSRGVLNWYLPPGICITLCVLSFYYINSHFEEKSKIVVNEEQSYMD
ncbi:ABC transporter permease subunit [Acetobacterium paludosum]|uniref:ABC transporter permease subunit n=1 Tax=Acetobacterium paludosum TaxID=52693 RepID=A0A923HUD7_9FIRM|nr:ABC transporter permease [Acetobacterium paludosum]MBC3887882.1 ABC transporter permease subunit [Acetobacterium paludosum]